MTWNLAKLLFVVSSFLIISLDVSADIVDLNQYRTDIIRDKSKDLLSVVRDYQQKAFVGFMIGIGWLITSEGARNYLKNNSIVRHAMLIATTALFITVLLTLVDYYMISEALFSQLLENQKAFESTSDLSNTAHRFKFAHLAISSIFNFILFTFLASLIYFQKNSN